jgi:predicted ATPase
VLQVLAVEGYRSLRQMVVPLRDLNVVTGPNGSGKSSLYRALRLLADASRNGAIGALAREGGLPSTLWAGPETIADSVRDGTHPLQGTVRRGPVALRLGFGGDDFSYAVDFGLPLPSKAGPGREESAFSLDPEIKSEAIWAGAVLRPSTLLSERHGPMARVRDDHGTWTIIDRTLRPYDSLLSELADPIQAPEVLRVREQVRSWRFYDHFSTAADSPARSARLATRTMVLGADGADLAAALQTIEELGDGDALQAAIDRAFPGSRLKIARRSTSSLEVTLHQPGLLRPLGAAELSEGTLRYLLLLAAVLSPRPPELLVLNEPETHLHPDLLTPLAELISDVAAATQVVVVSHADPLVAALLTGDLAEQERVQPISLIKDQGETRVEGANRFDEPTWHWPKR